ncbi:MAG: hypothetical protein ABJF88_18635 [Rhodothermales bacterium]
MLFTFLALLPWTSVQAQDEARIDVRVEHIAGENAYLDAGTERGIAADDTLDVWRGDVQLGRLRVVSATVTRAVVTFAGEPFPITRGQSLTVVRTAVTTPAEPVLVGEPDAPAPADRTSIFDQPTAPLPSSTRAEPIRLTGRLQVGTSALWSSTSPLVGDGAATTRSFATPFVGLRGRVTGLPGGLLVNLNGRASYRYRSDGNFDEPTDLRLYHASVEKRFSMVQVEAGRFFNEHDRFSGYLDGARVHVGSAVAGVGITAGLEPDRADGIFASDLPKYTVYGHYRISPKPLRVEVSAVAGQVLPQTEGLTSRTFAGGTARASGNGFSLSADVLVDRDPADDALALSRFLVRGSWSVLPRLRLRARYYHRRPYILFETIQVLRDASDRLGGGLSYTLGGRTFGGTVLRADLSRSTRTGDEASLTYSGGVYVPRLPGLGVGLNATGSVWTRDGQQSLYALASVTRSLGRAYVSLGYQFQQTPLLTESLTTHGIEGTLQIPLMDNVSATVQVNGSFGETISNARLYTGLWWRL